MAVQLPPHLLMQGTADWDQTIATNQHYMARELARGFHLTFVESLGLRRPELLSRRDLKRAANRVLARRRPNTPSARERPVGSVVYSPKVVPFHGDPYRLLNRFLMRRQLRTWRSHQGKRVYWTYSPVTYDFELDADLSIYHCVDLLGEFPGIDPELIDRAERRLAGRCDVAIGSSEVVVDHLLEQGFKEVIYWPNVADTAEISKSMNVIESTVRSGAVFAGNLSAKKVNFDLLLDLVANGGSLHLAGPIDEGGGASTHLIDELVQQGATYHGALSLTELSRLMARCKVGLIPYELNGYTRGVSPLKTYEYLAAGLSVVATELAGVQSRDDHVVIARSRPEFLQMVTRELAAPQMDLIPTRVRIADQHSWNQRGEQARKLLTERLLSRYADDTTARTRHD